MVIASDLKPGMMIRSEGQVYKVLEVESKAGAAKMGGVVKATLSNLHTSRLLENHFRPAEPSIPPGHGSGLSVVRS